MVKIGDTKNFYHEDKGKEITLKCVDKKVGEDGNIILNWKSV